MSITADASAFLRKFQLSEPTVSLQIYKAKKKYPRELLLQFAGVLFYLYKNAVSFQNKPRCGMLCFNLKKKSKATIKSFEHVNEGRKLETLSLKFSTSFTREKSDFQFS